MTHIRIHDIAYINITNLSRKDVLLAIQRFTTISKDTLFQFRA